MEEDERVISMNCLIRKKISLLKTYFVADLFNLAFLNFPYYNSQNTLYVFCLFFFFVFISADHNWSNYFYIFKFLSFFSLFK